MSGSPLSKCIRRIINRKETGNVFDRTDLLPSVEHVAHSLMRPGEPEHRPLHTNVFIQFRQDIESLDIKRLDPEYLRQSSEIPISLRSRAEADIPLEPP